MASIQFKQRKSGKRTYYVVLSFKGKHKWIKAGTLKSAKDLKKQLDSLEESKRIEKLGLSSQDFRVDCFFQEYSDHIRLHVAPSTVKRYLSVLNTFLVFLKMFHSNIKYVSQIKIPIIESYQKQRLLSVELKKGADGEKNGSHKGNKLPLPQTVNYEIGVLRSVFIWAKDRDIISQVPTAKVKKLKHTKKRSAQILSSKECKVLLRAGRELSKENRKLKVYTEALKFILNTGLRSGELCNLTWEDVNLNTGHIKIQAKEGWTPKTYMREFFLNETALSLLRKIFDEEGYVFKDLNGKQLEPDNLRRVLIKIAKHAGFDSFTRVHDLRHIFNSLMQMAGVDAGTMGRILGHKDIETTMIYTHQTQEHLKNSIEKIAI